MRFWVVKYGETVPFSADKKGGQLFRAGSISRELAKRGHEVIWWTGRFEHQTKSFIAPKNTDMLRDPESDLVVRLIDSPGYASNVSISRYIDHSIFRKRLQSAMNVAPAPDLILSSFPIPEVAKDCISFGKKRKIPVVTDVRDLWPDVIVGRLEDRFGYFPKSLTKMYERKVASILHESDAIFATSEGYLNWAQELGRRSPSSRKWDDFFLLSSEKPPSSSSFSASQRQVWMSKGVDFSRIVFCWAGSLSSQKTHVNMLEAFASLPPAVADRIQLVVCGGGDLENKIKLMAEQHSHIVFAGFVPNLDVKGLCLNSDVGLFCYDDVDSFRLNYTNKFGEYMGCGLPVLTTVTGAMVEGFAAKAIIQTGGSEVDDFVRILTQLSRFPPGERLKDAARKIHNDYFNAPKTYSKICESLLDIVEQFNIQA